MQRRLALAFFLTLAPVAAFAADTCTPPPAPSPGPALAAALAEVNRLRAEAGVAALTLNAKLTAAAQGHADDMAAKGYFSHTSQDGRTFVQRIQAAGYTNYTMLAENIASGQAGWYAAITAWKNSPGHRANMLNGNYKEIGLGAKGRYWVQDFGTARATTAAPLAATLDAGTGVGGKIGEPARFTVR